MPVKYLKILEEKCDRNIFFVYSARVSVYIYFLFAIIRILLILKFD